MIHDDHANIFETHNFIRFHLFFIFIFIFRIKRGGSRGFVLNDDSLDEGFFIESSSQGQNWLEKYQNRFANGEFRLRL